MNRFNTHLLLLIAIAAMRAKQLKCGRKTTKYSNNPGITTNIKCTELYIFLFHEQI